MTTDTERRRTGSPPALALILAWSLVVTGAVTPDSARAQSLAFTPVTVVDVREGVARPDMTVVVTDDRITAVGPEGSVQVPSGARVIDGTGKYLIPGLWDMHVHVSDDDSRTRSVYLPLFVAHGVTGIREMSGQSIHLQQREGTAAGRVLGPRMVVGRKVDGPNPWPTPTPEEKVGNAEEARRVADSLSDQGYDFIKTYQFLSPEAYRALHERGREIGLEISGEIPLGVSLWEAAAMGHRTVEHLQGVEFACSRREEELRVKYRREVAEISTDTTLRAHVPLWNRTEWEPLATWDPEKCRALYRHLVAHETWVVPTLMIQRYISYSDDPDIQNDPRQRYLPPGYWDPQADADWLDPERRFRPTYDHRQRTLPDLHRAGVGILAGSDVVGGFPLHDELAIFVEAGLTPLEALRTATLNPARYLKKTDSLGTVEEGKLADLVLLDANPLENISNIQGIRAVVANGRYFDRRALDGLLREAERAAKEPTQPALADTISDLAVESMALWNRLDPDAWLALFGDSVRWYYGATSLDRAGVEDMVRGLMSFTREADYRVLSEPDVEVLGSDAAVASFAMVQSATGVNGEELNEPTGLTLVYERREGDWKIVRVHESIGVPPDSVVAETILSRTRELASAWERLDADAYLAHFSEDLTFYFEGSRFSRIEFETVVRQAIGSLRESTFEVLSPEVEVLGPNAAVISFELREVMVDTSGASTDLRGLLTLVYERRQGQWLVVRAHETLRPPDRP